MSVTRCATPFKLYLCMYVLLPYLPTDLFLHIRQRRQAVWQQLLQVPLQDNTSPVDTV
jgi:hypothetical protein